MIQSSSHGLKSTQIPPSSRIILTAITSVAKEVFTVGFSSSTFLHISLALSPTIHVFLHSSERNVWCIIW